MSELNVHPTSPVGRARQRVANATEQHDACVAELSPLEHDRAVAQTRLAQLESLPVDLKKFDTARELEIASLRRGLTQLQAKIDEAQRDIAHADRQRRSEITMAGELERELGIATHNLDLLADLSHRETEVLTIRQHRQLLEDNTKTVDRLTSAPEGTHTNTRAAVAA